MQGEGFGEAQTACIGSRDSQGNGLFIGVINMLPSFQLQLPLSGYFKAFITDGITVFVLPIRINGVQPTNFHTILAFGNGRLE